MIFGLSLRDYAADRTVLVVLGLPTLTQSVITVDSWQPRTQWLGGFALTSVCVTRCNCISSLSPSAQELRMYRGIAWDCVHLQPAGTSS